MKGMGRARLLRLFCTAAVLIGLVAFVPPYYHRQMQKKYSAEISEYIDSELKYETDRLDEEYSTMMGWIGNREVSDADRGCLYERVSLIYQLRGETLDYYRCLGSALYYLEASGETARAANIYADLANYYMNNNACEKAQEMLDEIYSMCAVDRLGDLQVESYVYRMQAVVNRTRQEYEEALAQIALSEACLQKDPDGYYQESYHAMNDIVCASVWFEEGEYQKAQDVIDEYAESGLFEQQIYREVQVRDFILPYYAVASRLAAYHQDAAQCETVIETYCDYCEKYGYYKQELNTLLYLLNNLPSAQESNNQILYQKINDAYLKVTDMQSDEYTALINGQLQDSMDEQKNLRMETQSARKRGGRITFAVFMAVILLFVIYVVVREGNRDGLTGIGNRRALNAALKWKKRLRREYTVIMLDVDNFKQVNDTYGHEEGDRVLETIGEILRTTGERTARPFRYGGEEFVLLLEKATMSKTLNVAEYIRQQMADVAWEHGRRITVSLGVAESTGSDALREADKNLYFSKANGKNVVSFSADGRRVMYQTTIQESGSPQKMEPGEAKSTEESLKQTD